MNLSVYYRILRKSDNCGRHCERIDGIIFIYSGHGSYSVDAMSAAIYTEDMQAIVLPDIFKYFAKFHSMYVIFDACNVSENIKASLTPIKQIKDGRFAMFTASPKYVPAYSNSYGGFFLDAFYKNFISHLDKARDNYSKSKHESYRRLTLLDFMGISRNSLLDYRVDRMIKVEEAYGRGEDVAPDINLQIPKMYLNQNVRDAKDTREAQGVARIKSLLADLQIVTQQSNASVAATKMNMPSSLAEMEKDEKECRRLLEYLENRVRTDSAYIAKETNILQKYKDQITKCNRILLQIDHFKIMLRVERGRIESDRKQLEKLRQRA